MKIAFGTDSGVGPHGDNASEFVYMVEAGMPAAFALQTATINAAQVMGVDDTGRSSRQPRRHRRRAGRPDRRHRAETKVDFVMKDGIVYRP